MRAEADTVDSYTTGGVFEGGLKPSIKASGVKPSPRKYRATRRHLTRAVSVCLEEVSAEHIVIVPASNHTFRWLVRMNRQSRGTSRAAAGPARLARFRGQREPGCGQGC